MENQAATPFDDDAKNTLATIAQHLQLAAHLFCGLTNEQRDFTLDFHNENSSLNHCLRWGEQACEDLAQSLGVPLDPNQALGEHPQFTRQDWKHEVLNDDTNLGYQQWVCHQIDAQSTHPAMR